MTASGSMHAAARLLGLMLVCAASATGLAQTSSPAPAASATVAPTQAADLFDFWLGDWALSWRNDDGSAGTGRNRITKILDGSVIQEDFEALPGNPPPLLKGRSLSVLSNGVWRQSWVDNQGGFFAFTAQVDGARRIFITPTRPKDGKALVQRMVFHSIMPRALTWDWESSADGGQTWTLQWRVQYSR